MFSAGIHQQPMFETPLVLWHVSLLCTLCCALQQILKRIYSKNPLDNIPGPPPESYLWGPFDSDLELIEMLVSLAGYVAGNFKQIFNPQSWAFHRNLVDHYGGVAKIYGTFGVSRITHMMYPLLKSSNAG